MILEEGQVFLINKPLEWTSFDVVKKMRNLIRTKFNLKKIKVGHAGTLDPLATGLLIICVGKFTKKINEYQAQEKEYQATFTLGATRPSHDLETEINQHYATDHINDSLIEEARKKFIGDIMQVPPVYSAVKQNGKRLYEHARNGQEVKIKERLVNIKSFEITQVEIPIIKAKIICSKGTYIRSLAYDFGLSLNSGGYLSELIRTRIGNHKLNNAMSLNEFEDYLDTIE